MPQLELSHFPSCHVQVVNPRAAGARTSSLHQHEPRRDDHRPSISSTHGDEMENLNNLESQGVPEFFCFVGLFSNPHQPPKPSQLQHHLAQNKHQHKHQHRHQDKEPHEQCPRRSATLPRARRTLPANQAAQYLKGRTPPTAQQQSWKGTCKGPTNLEERQPKKSHEAQK